MFGVRTSTSSSTRCPWWARVANGATFHFIRYCSASHKICRRRPGGSLPGRAIVASEPGTDAGELGQQVDGSSRHPGTPHALRYWFGSALREGGVDSLVIKELMGHESLATTAIYVDVPVRQRIAVISGLS